MSHSPSYFSWFTAVKWMILLSLSLEQLTDKGTQYAYFQKDIAIPHITYNFIPANENIKFEFLTVNVKVTVLQDVKLCSVVHMYQCFLGTCCHHRVTVKKMCSLNDQRILGPSWSQNQNVCDFHFWEKWWRQFRNIIHVFCATHNASLENEGGTFSVCHKLHYVTGKCAWLLENITFSRYCNIMINEVGRTSISSSGSLCEP